MKQNYFNKVTKFAKTAKPINDFLDKFDAEFEECAMSFELEFAEKLQVFEEKQETYDFCRQLMVDGFEEHQLTLGFIRQLVLDCVYEAVQEEIIIEDNEIKGYF